MRMYATPVLSLGLIFGLGLIQQPTAKPPLEDERDDDHGTIHWVSTAELRVSGTQWWWEYTRTVENRDKGRRCHVNWAPDKSYGWEGMIEPAKTIPAGHANTDLPPEVRRERILYNGGSAPGEAAASAPFWHPQTLSGGDEHSIESTALISFDLGQLSYRAQVRATSRMWKLDEMKYLVSYQLTLSREVPSGVYVRWDSIESPELEQLMGVENVRRGKYVREIADTGGVFAKSVITSRRPALRDQSIRFLDGKDHILARAWLPALASPVQSQSAQPRPAN